MKKSRRTKIFKCWTFGYLILPIKCYGRWWKHWTWVCNLFCEVLDVVILALIINYEKSSLFWANAQGSSVRVRYKHLRFWSTIVNLYLIHGDWVYLNIYWGFWNSSKESINKCISFIIKQKDSHQGLSNVMLCVHSFHVDETPTFTSII